MNRLLNISIIFLLLYFFNTALLATITNHEAARNTHEKNTILYMPINTSDSSIEKNKYKNTGTSWWSPTKTAIAKGIATAIVIGGTGFAAYWGWGRKEERNDYFPNLATNLSSHSEFNRWVNNTSNSMLNTTPNNMVNTTLSGTTDTTENNIKGTMCNNFTECQNKIPDLNKPLSCFFKK